MYSKTKHIHFVGIGGIGMSGIAELLANLGYKVSGSDLSHSHITDRLSSLGCTVRIGHDELWVQGADVVVTSSAIAPENPEVDAANRAGIPVIMRAEMLAELMRLTKYGIAIAGSHGKTSTTSMVASLAANDVFQPQRNLNAQRRRALKLIAVERHFLVRFQVLGTNQRFFMNRHVFPTLQLSILLSSSTNASPSIDLSFVLPPPGRTPSSPRMRRVCCIGSSGAEKSARR